MHQRHGLIGLQMQRPKQRQIGGGEPVVGIQVDGTPIALLRIGPLPPAEENRPLGGMRFRQLRVERQRAGDGTLGALERLGIGNNAVYDHRPVRVGHPDPGQRVLGVERHSPLEAVERLLYSALVPARPLVATLEVQLIGLVVGGVIAHHLLRPRGAELHL